MTSLRILLAMVAAGLAAELAAADRALVLDPAQSHIDVAVKATLDSFVAHLDTYESELVVGDDGWIVRARLAFHFLDVRTGKDSRDQAMHRWQETEKYPDGVFLLTSLEPGEGGRATARGRLTLHGIARELSFPVSINRDGSRYAIDGDATLDTREFGLPGIRVFMVLKVDPVVHVRFHLQGATEPAARLSQAQR